MKNPSPCFIIVILVIHLFVPSPAALGAACCGGGAAAPTVITGDDRAQFSASFAQSKVVGDAPAAGIPVFRADGDNELAQTVRLEGAVLVTDRWQAGASFMLTRRARGTANVDSTSSLGIGDLSLSGAYEFLPEWEYSNWQPRGFLFGQALIPTGGSIYEASLSTSQPWGLDARGRGFYALGIGALLLKSWGNWDASILAEIHRSFAHSFGDLHLTPGFGASTALSGGYSPSRLPLRFGLALSPTYEDGITAEGAENSVSNSQLVWNASALLGWMVGHSSTLSATYTDQTLMGPASNVSLSRTLMLLYQRRWER